MEFDRKKVLSFHYSILHPWLYPDNHKKILLPYIWLIQPVWFLKIQHINIFAFNKSGRQAVSSNLTQIKETALFCNEREIEYILVYTGKVHDEVMKQLNDMHIPTVDFRNWSEIIQFEHEYNWNN